MFLGGMKENSQEEVVINGISKDVFSQLLQFIYKGKQCSKNTKLYGRLIKVAIYMHLEDRGATLTKQNCK